MAKKRVSLALQGGGAHGAFTWGVLDRLLKEEDIEIEGVSGTSAGAMNGAMVTSGIKAGGREEARRRLKDFWRDIRDAHPLNQPPWRFISDFVPGGRNSAALEYNPGYLLGDVISRFLSPYQFNPANLNPLRAAIERQIDFTKVVRTDNPKLFVCATDVQSGRAKVFSGDEISVDALLASACLPFMFQAVRVEGRDYWDGGYTGNPSIWPLIYDCACGDVMLVQINPIEREETPTEARAILNRVNEISFNSNLMGEMRAIELVNRMISRGEAPEPRYRPIRIHAIEDPETMRRLTVSTKLTPDWRMLKDLRDAGREAMDAWLAEHKDKIGVESSIDIAEKYL